MTKHVVGFVGSVLVLPVVAQAVDLPDTMIQKLAVGSAQFVLSVVAAIEFIILVKIVCAWRTDIATARNLEKEERATSKAENKEERKEFSELLKQTVTAMTIQSETNREVAETSRDVKDSIAALNVTIEYIQKDRKG